MTSLFKPAEPLPQAMAPPPPSAQAAAPPVVGTQAQGKSQKRGPAAPTMVGGAAGAENLGNKTLIGQ